jgi:hypothetical protein
MGMVARFFADPRDQQRDYEPRPGPHPHFLGRQEHRNL